jgi:hypothetical protein
VAIEDFKKVNIAGDIDNLVQLINSAQTNKNIKLDRYATEITQIDNSISNTSDLNSIDNLVAILKANKRDYRNNVVSNTASDNVINKASNRKQTIEFYHNKIDEMAQNYIGTKSSKGYQNLDKNDFKYYDYDYISKELEKIRDFKNIFQDKTYDINSYNNQNIRTSQLKDRIDQYEGKMLTALEAVKGDNLITDNELIYIISGDKDGLTNARTGNIQSLNQSKQSITRATGAIKKNIASLRKWLVQKNVTIDLEKSPVNISDFKLTDYLLDKDSGVNNMLNMQDYYGKIYDMTKLGDENEDILREDRDSFINSEISKSNLTNPVTVLSSWQEELQAYEMRNQKIDLEIKKWGGTNLSGFDKDEVDSKEDDMYNSVFDVMKLEEPKSINELPLDLQSTERGYYSQETGKFYNTSIVDELLSNF